MGFPACSEAASFCWKCQAEVGCISIATAWVFSSLRWTHRGCLLRDTLTAKENRGHRVQTCRQMVPFPGARAGHFLPASKGNLPLPGWHRSQPPVPWLARGGFPGTEGPLCLAGKGRMNVINYGICFCHKQIFCHCFAPLLKFTVHGTRDDICIINNCKAGMSWCCTSTAMIRKSRAPLRHSTGVICRGAGGAAPARGLAAGALPGFYF